ncbi:MAG: hypothetical protein HRT88_04045, partial [Lentisphaeraceae bacterium]|nr:hypothetical protein [Lentisphaeraceae bacterium]
MDKEPRKTNIDFAAYFDLAKVSGDSDLENISDHELLTPLKENNQRYPELRDINRGGM